MPLMFQPLARYADFNGRARRSEYWLFTLFLWILWIVVIVIAATAGGENQTAQTMSPGAAVAMVLLCLVWLGLILPSLAVTVRRLHDSDHSGWWMLIAFLPFIGGVVLLIFTLIDGTRGPNQYGPDPKARQPYAAGPSEVHHYHHTVDGPGGETPAAPSPTGGA